MEGKKEKWLKQGTNGGIRMIDKGRGGAVAVQVQVPRTTSTSDEGEKIGESCELAVLSSG